MRPPRTSEAVPPAAAIVTPTAAVSRRIAGRIIGNGGAGGGVFVTGGVDGGRSGSGGAFSTALGAPDSSSARATRLEGVDGAKAGVPSGSAAAGGASTLGASGVVVTSFGGV